jgi:regulator of RNase E activity RraA
MANSSESIDDAISALKKLPTGVVFDSLNMAGIQGAVMGIRPTRGFEGVRVVGPASTILYTSPHPESPRLHNYEAIQASPPGSILVIDGKGLDMAFAGDNQAAFAARHGLAGMVIYGGVRDVAGLRDVGMPVFSTGSATRVNNLQVGAYGVPVEIGGVLVRPGDIVIADEDGVVIVPVGALGTVLENIKTVLEVESGMEKAIQEGAPVAQLEAVLAKKKPRK